jgi:hypothetical protein
MQCSFSPLASTFDALNCISGRTVPDGYVKHLEEARHGLISTAYLKLVEESSGRITLFIWTLYFDIG